MKRAVFSFTAFLCAGICVAQSRLMDIDRKLAREYSRLVDYAYASGAPERYDSIETINTRFGNQLLWVTGKYPASLTFSFDSLETAGLSIVSSADGRLRIYSWDTWTGGTMHFFENIFQYKSAGKIKSVMLMDEEGTDPKSWYSSIHSLKWGRRTLYLGIFHSIGSTVDKGGGIRLFEISNSGLNDSLRLIRTTSGMQNEISFYYNLRFISEETGFPEASFDARSKTILIPLISIDGKPSTRFIKYQWNGKRFEKHR